MQLLTGWKIEEETERESLHDGEFVVVALLVWTHADGPITVRIARLAYQRWWRIAGLDPELRGQRTEPHEFTCHDRSETVQTVQTAQFLFLGYRMLHSVICPTFAQSPFVQPVHLANCSWV